ncbi:MAG: hypothetical protein ACRCSG_03935 [Cellulosilyticaceae bacterium]
MLIKDKKIKNYGFIDKEGMPSGKYREVVIKSAENREWVRMSSFEKIAKEHCATTFITNLALYFAKLGKNKLLINNSNVGTFKAIYSITGDGPVLRVATDAKKYFETRGYNLKYSSINNFIEIKEAIDAGRPCGILLAKNIFAWHWVLCIGYVEYEENKSEYIRIITGWDSDINEYYKLNTGSVWVSATQYWVE